MGRRGLTKKQSDALATMFAPIIIAVLVGDGIIEGMKYISSHRLAMILVITAIVATIALLVLRTKVREKRHRRFVEESRKLLLEKLKEHRKTLGIRRKQILQPNAYGYVDKKQRDEWKNEVGTFLTSIQFPPYSLFSEQEVLEFLFLIEQTSEESSKELIFDIENVSPLAYETMCAEILSDAGWKARTTRGSGDQGVDVVAEKDGEKVVIQCKLYSRPVGNKAVQEISAGKSYYGARHAAVVSNQVFTPSAKELAQSTGVLLLHHEELSELEERIRRE